MPCDCINEVTEKTKAFILEKNPSIKEIDWLVIPATFSENRRVGISTHLRVVDTLGNGKEKVKESVFNIVASYCPFCGEKYQD